MRRNRSISEDELKVTSWTHNKRLQRNFSHNCRCSHLSLLFRQHHSAVTHVFSHIFCHCLEQRDFSLLSNACCDHARTPSNTGDYQDMHMHNAPLYHSWVTERGETAVEELELSLLVGCPSLMSSRRGF